MEQIQQIGGIIFSLGFFWGLILVINFPDITGPLGAILLATTIFPCLIGAIFFAEGGKD